MTLDETQTETIPVTSRSDQITLLNQDEHLMVTNQLGMQDVSEKSNGEFNFRIANLILKLNHAI